MQKLATVAVLLALAACAGGTSQPKSPSPLAAAVADSLQDGSSYERAVVIHASSERSGVAAEYRWLAQHYPGYTRGMQAVGPHGRRMYDYLTITTAEGKEKTITFDITNFYGHY